MSVDDELLTRAMSASPENLSKSESERLMEFLWLLRSGGELTPAQRAQLHEIAVKAGVKPAS